MSQNERDGRDGILMSLPSPGAIHQRLSDVLHEARLLRKLLPVAIEAEKQRGGEQQQPQTLRLHRGG